jgi:hypothetical protein
LAEDPKRGPCWRFGEEITSILTLEEITLRCDKPEVLFLALDGAMATFAAWSVDPSKSLRLVGELQRSMREFLDKAQKAEKKARIWFNGKLFMGPEWT